MTRIVRFLAFVLCMNLLTPIHAKAQEPKDTVMRIPPAWAFGVLYGTYAPQEKIDVIVEKLLSEGYPIDALWIDSWFWDFQTKGKGPKGYISFAPDSSGYPNISALWKKLEANHIKSGIWIWDAILKDGNEEVFREFETKGFFRKTFVNKDRWHNSEGKSIIGEIDFSNPKAVSLWRQKLRPLFHSGLDFLKLDRASDIAFLDAAFQLTAKDAIDSKGRGFILSHCHDLANAELRRYPAKWTGDAKIAWTQPDYPDLRIYAMGALKENIEMLSNPKKQHHFVPFLGNDAGGYDFFGSTDTLQNWDELYIRWIQFSSFAPIMMIFSTHKNPRENLPFNFSKKAQKNFKRFTGLRQSLFPYRYSSALREKYLGEKWIGGDSLRPHQFSIGSQLLIAPIFEKGARKRSVSLPEGKWINHNTLQTLEGGTLITAKAALDEIPLFVKAGSILPMIPEVQMIEKRSRDTLILQLYPEGKSQYELYEDDGESEAYLSGKIAITRFEMNEVEKSLRITPLPTKQESVGKRRVFLLKFMTKKPKQVFHNGMAVKKSPNGFLIEGNDTLALSVTWK